MNQGTLSASEKAPPVTSDEKAAASTSAPSQEETTPTATADPSATASGFKASEEAKANEEPMEASGQTATLEDVWKILCNLETRGTTCVGGPATMLPSIPGLHVEGIGSIGLPIGPEQAKKLASIAQQAPHGRGMETIVDTAVRNSWQIEPSKVKLENPAWQASLKKLVDSVADSLGVMPSNVRSELYKLLLYEPGGFFKKHRDTEKADGMFATLVIQLPSRHTGGSLIVNHGRQSKTFTMGVGADSAFTCHYVAHYADCEHEITPVEGDYRLALIYSLCYSGAGNKPSAADVAAQDGELRSVLNRLPSAERYFLLPLKHYYTAASLGKLGLKCLKGKDRDLCKAIESAGDGTWKALVATVSRTDHESGDCSDGEFEPFETEEGYPSCDGIYGVGSDVMSTKISRQLIERNLCSLEDGGRLLGDYESIEQMWGRGDSGPVAVTGNEGTTRDTTYRTCVFLALRTTLMPLFVYK